MLPPAAVSWSSGKDAAFAACEAHRLGIAGIVAAFTTVSAADGHVPIHGVSARALADQVDATGWPHVTIALPEQCPNAVYEATLRDAFDRLRGDGIRHVVFGDLFLDDIRAYRDRLLASCGMVGLYPLWKRDTHDVARDIVRCGIRARIVAVDGDRLDAGFVGRAYDKALFDTLPATVDPCGENGEFHTFVEAAPMMSRTVSVDGATRGASRSAARGEESGR